MRLVEIHSDWMDRLDALLEAYYIDTTKEKRTDDGTKPAGYQWDGQMWTGKSHRLSDSEQGGVGIGTVIPKKGVVVIQLDQEALDYPAEEIAKQIQLVAAEFSASHRTLEIDADRSDDGILWPQVEQAVNSLIKRGVLADMDDPDEGSNRHLFRINQLGPRDMEGASTTAQTAYAGKAGGLPPDLIAKIEDQLLQPFHAHAGYKNYAAPQVQRKQAGRPDDPSLLQKAVRLHKKFFGGRRWPALETALLYRSNTMGQSPGGDFVRPRITSFCTYMNSLTTPWPDGDKIMANFIVGHNGYEILDYPDGQRYLQKRPKLMKVMAKQIFTLLVKYPLSNIRNDNCLPICFL